MATSDSRPLNSFEALFASCNIRFAILLSLGKGGIYTLEVQEAVKKTNSACRLGSLELEQMGDSWQLKQINSPSSSGGTYVVTVDDYTAVLDFGRVLDERIKMVNLPASGNLCIELIETTSQPGKTIAILMNGNHALADGRSLVHYATTFVQYCTSKYASNDPHLPEMSQSIIPDWRDLVAQVKTPNWSASPSYLHSDGCTILTAQELNSGTGESMDFRVHFPSDIVPKLKQLLKKFEGEKISITGLIIAVLMLSFAKIFCKSLTKYLSKEIGISVLVDLRQALSEFKLEQIPLAIGTVTVSIEVKRLLSVDTLDTQLNLAALVTKQLQERVDRGEAIRCAQALTAGKFSDGTQAATLELSNLGVIDLPSDMTMHTAQRFDDYDGISCMMHTEKATETMKWAIGIGAGLDAIRIQKAFRDAAIQIQLMAATA